MQFAFILNECPARARMPIKNFHSLPGTESGNCGAPMEDASAAHSDSDSDSAAAAAK